jgi:hypothetical protein
MRPAILLPGMVGAGESGYRLAVEAPGPIAPRDLAALGKRRGQRARRRPLACHGTAPAAPTLLDDRALVLGGVVQEMGGALSPAGRAVHGRPPGSRGRQAAAEQWLQAPQWRGARPFFATRSRLSALAVRRVCRGSPEASQGGRPSAGRARRTAWQDARLPVAAASGRPARWRALGRTPRRDVFRAFFACRSASERGWAALRREWK